MYLCTIIQTFKLLLLMDTGIFIFVHLFYRLIWKVKYVFLTRYVRCQSLNEKIVNFTVVNQKGLYSKPC